MNMVSAVHTNERITRESTTDLQQVQTISTQEMPLHLSISPDGKQLASSNKHQLLLIDLDAPAAKQQHALFSEHYAWITRYQQNGKVLVSSGGIFDGTVRFWNTHTMQTIGSIGKRMRPVLGLDFHPNGDVLAGAGWGGNIWLWKVVDGSEITVKQSHETLIRTLAFSPDGRFIASAGGIFDGNIKIWYVDDDYGVHLFDAYTHLSSKLLYSPNGQYIASAGRDRIILLWNTRDGQEHASLYGHADEVRDIAFSPDGNILASAGGDGTVRLWDVASGKPLLVLPEHGRRVRSVVFSPQGDTLYSAGDDKNIRVWRIS